MVIEYRDVNTLIKEYGFEDAIDDMRITPESVVLLIYYLFGRLQSHEQELQRKDLDSLQREHFLNNAYVDALKTKEE